MYFRCRNSGQTLINHTVTINIIYYYYYFACFSFLIIYLVIAERQIWYVGKCGTLLLRKLVGIRMGFMKSQK